MVAVVVEVVVVLVLEAIVVVRAEKAVIVGVGVQSHIQQLFFILEFASTHPGLHEGR